MTRKFGLRCLAVLNAPNKELVVIASRCKLLLIETQLEPAHLLFMPNELRLKVILRPQISMENRLVSGTSAQKSAVPCDAADSAIMACKLLDHFALSSVPYL